MEIIATVLGESLFAICGGLVLCARYFCCKQRHNPRDDENGVPLAAHPEPSSDQLQVGRREDQAETAALVQISQTLSAVRTSDDNQVSALSF